MKDKKYRGKNVSKLMKTTGRTFKRRKGAG